MSDTNIPDLEVRAASFRTHMEAIGIPADRIVDDDLAVILGEAIFERPVDISPGSRINVAFGDGEGWRYELGVLVHSCPSEIHRRDDGSIGLNIRVAMLGQTALKAIKPESPRMFYNFLGAPQYCIDPAREATKEELEARLAETTMYDPTGDTNR